MCVEAALEVKEKYKDKIDIQICSQVLEGATMDGRGQGKVAKLLKEADMSVIVCSRAMIDNKQPRHKVAPIHNSIAPVPHLLAAGVNVCIGVDNVYDYFCSFIDGDVFKDL